MRSKTGLAIDPDPKWSEGVYSAFRILLRSERGGRRFSCDALYRVTWPVEVRRGGTASRSITGRLARANINFALEIAITNSTQVLISR